MILFTKENCPLCKMAKTKLNAANIDFTECSDENIMEELGIDMLPVAKINDELLGISQILELIKEKANGN